MLNKFDKLEKWQASNWAVKTPPKANIKRKVVKVSNWDLCRAYDGSLFMLEWLTEVVTL